MKSIDKRRMSTEKMVLSAVITALVIVLQWLGTSTTFFGPFSTAVALIPIVIGAAICGPAIGAWLGFVFGMVVLLSGGASLFLAYNIPGTIITVLVKGIMCGLVAGLVYKLFEKINKFVSIVIAALVCPIVNTGVFLLGCMVFFMKHADAIASELSIGVTGMDLFLALAMANFVFEIGMSAVLSPVFVKVINLAKKK